jgi:hypothetical protein
MRDLVRLVGLDKMEVTLSTDRETNRLHKSFKFENRKYTWGTVAVCLLSPSIIQSLDLALYTPSEIIGLANFLEETRIFGSSSANGTAIDADARAFLNSLYGGLGNHTDSSGPFLKLPATTVSRVRLYLEPPGVLAEWAVNLGLIHQDEIDKLFGVPNLCFLNTPWDDDRFALKTLLLLNTIMSRSERLTKGVHPRVLAALWAGPQYFQPEDIVQICERFKIPNIELASARTDLDLFKNSLLEFPSIFCLQCLNDRVNSPIKHYSWVLAILCLYQSIPSTELEKLIQEQSIGDQHRMLTDMAYGFAAEQNLFMRDWSSAPRNHILWIHDSMRLYNIYDFNPPRDDFNGMLAQILTTLLWCTPPGLPNLAESIKNQWHQVTHVYPNGYCTLRPGSSLQWGPADGQGYNRGTPLFGPASEADPRVRMNSSRGMIYANTLPHRPGRSSHSTTGHTTNTTTRNTEPDLSLQDLTLDNESDVRAGFPSHSELITSHATRVTSRNPTHGVAHVWAQKCNAMYEYTNPPHHVKSYFMLQVMDGLAAGCSAVCNSLRISDEYNHTAKYDHDDIDSTFKRAYEYRRVKRFEKGIALLVLNPYMFFEECVQRGERGDFPLCRFSHTEFHHIFIMSVDFPNKTMVCRMLLNAGTSGAQAMVFPKPDVDFTISLPSRGAFAVTNGKVFSALRFLDAWAQINAASATQTTPQTTVPPPQGESAAPVRDQDSFTPKKARRRHRRKSSLSHNSSEGQELLDSDDDSEDESVEHNYKRSRTSDTEEEASSTPLRLDPSLPPLRRVFESMSGKRNFNRLAKAGIVIPPKPSRDTPCLCLINWAYCNGARSTKDRDCDKMDDGTCNRLHRKNMIPGLISYESVRYQIGYFHCGEVEIVRELLDLVEKEKVFFLPEEEM